MTTLLLIRHGQSQANLERVFAGHFDVALTETGWAQARATAEFVKENYTLDRVYASDLSRACNTGRAVAEACGVEIVADPALREIRAGKWEGIAIATLLERYPVEYGLWRSDIGSSCPVDGEPVAAVADRMVAALSRIAEENPGKTVAVATHGAAIRAAQSVLSGVGLKGMQEISYVTNASVTELYWEDGVFRFGRISMDGHLGQLRTVPVRV